MLKSIGMRLFMTILGLLPWVGVAYAGNGGTANTELTRQITLSGYTTGGSYSYSVHIANMATSGDERAFTIDFGSNYYLVSQGGSYVGLVQASEAQAASSTSVADPGGWVDPTSTANGKNSWVMTGGNTHSGWISYTAAGEKSQTRPVANTSNTFDAGIELTLSYDKLQNLTTLTLAMPAVGTTLAAVTQEICMSGVYLNPGDFKVNDYRTYIDVSNVKFQLTDAPEPTTATLSLLALAGLVIRRRRRAAH